MSLPFEKKEMDLCRYQLQTDISLGWFSNHWGTLQTPGAPGGLDRNIRRADASMTRTHGENTAHFTVIHTANTLKNKRKSVDQLGFIRSACSVRVTGTRGPRIPNASHGKETPQGNSLHKTQRLTKRCNLVKKTRTKSQTLGIPTR